MKNITIAKAGGVEYLKYNDVEMPKLGPQDVLIKTKAISVNPVDFKVRADETLLDLIVGTQRPIVIGLDVAGEILEKGEDPKSQVVFAPYLTESIIFTL